VEEMEQLRMQKKRVACDKESRKEMPQKLRSINIKLGKVGKYL